MRTVHFDVDSVFNDYFEGEKYSFPITEVTQVPKPEEIDIITIGAPSFINAQTLSPYKNLKLVITRSVGIDHLNLEDCRQCQVAAYHLEDYGSFNIAEHTIGLILAGVRNIVSCQKEIKQGIFSYTNFKGISLQGKTLGIIGTGKIGLETIKMAKVFGLNILAYDIVTNEQAVRELGFSYVSLDELLAKSDIISLHTPLTDQTKHMINKQTIAQMKDGVILINTARGGLVSTNDLVSSISKFRFVGLDVLEEEKSFTKDHPLLSFENVVITPHIAFLTDLSLERIALETQKCIDNFLSGNPQGRVA